MAKQFGKYSDAELCKALLSSKKDREMAFAELYSRHSQRIYAYCLRVTGNLEEAQDIFQETFMAFYKSRMQIKTNECIASYLVKIAHNLCVNYQKKQKNDFKLEDFNMPTNEINYEKQEMLDLIAEALNLLDFEHRDAFVLRMYQGLSYEEISLITGISVNGVRNRVWRAKDKIKNILEPFMKEMSN